MRRHHVLGAIGALVGVATAGVIVLMVMQDDPDEERREPSRPALVVPEIPKTLPTPPKPSKVAADDKAKADAAAKKKADDDAKKAAQQRAGVLGSTALAKGRAFASLTGTGKLDAGFDDKNLYGGLLGKEAGEMNGGFGYGRSGFGPGGGGTGWGTIGTGRYGTIGRGTGDGVGYGTGRGAIGTGSLSSRVMLSQPNVSPVTPGASDPGALDAGIVRRYLRRNLQRLEACQGKTPKVAGTISVTFVVVETGRITNVRASGIDPAIASCVAGVIGSIELPKPRGTGGVDVTTTFTFKP